MIEKLKRRATGLLFLMPVACIVVSLCNDNSATYARPTIRQGGVELTQSNLSAWRAGTKVSLKAVEAFGLERCFQAMSIPDGVFSRMKGKSYKWDCTVPRTELRYLKVLHYDLNGEICIGEIVCNKSIAADLVDIFRNLFNARYPIGRMVLVDEYGADDVRSMSDNNTSCFNFRHVAGSKKLSNHSKGKAIDINPLYNPCVRKRSGSTLHVSPQTGKKYADRSKKFVCKIDKSDLCYKEFLRHGFSWGGNWHSLKDYQHFEKE